VKRWIPGVLIMLLVLTGCSKKEEGTAEMKKKAIPVKVETLKRGTFSCYLTYKGTVQPWRRANIAPDASGRIDKIYKKQGDRVRKGDLLAELDTTTLRLQAKQARAATAVAEAGYRDAELNHKRLKSLREKNAVSQMQLEKAELALEAAETEKKSAQANLDLVTHTLENSIMRAPFDGIITLKNMEEGDIINPMMGMGASVLTLMDLSRVKVVLDVAAENIETIAPGQSCIVRVISLPEETFSGTVYSKNLAADPVSKTFKIETVIENPETRIKAGVFADVAIEICHLEDTLLLPAAALIDNRYVVLYDNGVARQIPVKVGKRNANHYQVIEGLEAGQEVVVEGNYDLKDGADILREEAGQ